MMRRDWRLLAGYAAVRTVGLAALGGMAALSVGLFGTGTADGASKTHSTSPALTTSVSFAADVQLRQASEFAQTWRCHGQVDFVHHAIALAVTLPTFGLHASDDSKSGLLAGNRPLMLKGEWVGDHAYLSVPSALALLVGHASELSVPLSATLTKQIDADLDQTAVALTYTHLLMNAITGHQIHHQLPPRSIDGVRVTGTRVELTVSQLLKVIPGLSPALVNPTKSLANQMVPVTVWVDRDGRLVEFVMAASSKPDLTSISGTVRFSNYDATTALTAPPSSTVAPLPTTFRTTLRQLLHGLTH